MAHLISYGMLSTSDNSLAGNLVKAQCDFCGRKYGSIEEARKCENEHLNSIINNLYNFTKNMEGK